MPDALRIVSEFDVGPIVAGAETAAKAVQSASQRMTDSLLKSGLSAKETESALRNMGYSADEARAALGGAAASLDQVTTASDRTAGSVNNARIAFTGLTQEMGIRGSRALGSFIGQSSALAPILSAAFPVIAAIALFEIIDTGIEKLHKLAMEGELNAEAWQKIDHESNVALESAQKGIQELEVRLTELTSGKLEALRLQMRFIGDGSIEMSSKMLTMFDQMGKQEDEQIGKLGRLKQFITAFAEGGALGAGIELTLPTQGEAIKGFGSELSKTLDTQGTAAGIKLVEQGILQLDEALKKSPDAKGLKEYREQLSKIRDVLNSGLKTEELQKTVNLAEQNKLLSDEAKKYIETLAKMYDEDAALTQRSAEKELRDIEKVQAERERLEEEMSKTTLAMATKDLETFQHSLTEKVHLQEESGKAEIEQIRANAEMQQKAMEATSFAGAADPRLIQIADAALDQQAFKIMDLIALEEKLRQQLTQTGLAETDPKIQESLARQQQLVQQLTVAMQKYDNAVQNVSLKQLKDFKSSFEQISNEFNQSIVGWMNGTETFGRAMAKLWTNMADQAVTALLKIAEQELVGLALHQKMADTQKLSDAKVAAANTYASVSAVPIIGPVLAPAAAAAAFAAVLAFEKGGIVPETGLAMLHSKEMVLPAHISQSVQQMADGGGGSAGPMHVHFHGPQGGQDHVAMEKQLVSMVKRARRKGSV